tara:strand:+ start:1793 stop:3646 length:1854 start_codon:yes stop_codon:yes gene_type:complete
MHKLNLFPRLVLITALFVFPAFIFSQSTSNLDEDFLKSLPEDLQEELSTENTEENQVDKLLNSKTSSLKNKEALKLLKQKIEELDGKINKPIDINDQGGLERFGDSFFSSIQSTFMPVNVPNLRDDYILGVGDKISIQIVGERSEISNGLTIERDGSLSIPDLGKVFVAGSALSEAKKIIDNYVQSKTIGNEVFITLSELRDISIIILGGAVNPGIYTISGGSNILHAINVAGGISEKGSYRKVKILRKGSLIKTVDLYETLIYGKGLFDFDLRSGDTILIEPLDFIVALSGGVNNPAFYDIKIGETVDDLVNFAGGFSQDYNQSENIILQRDTSVGTDIISLEQDKIADIPLQPRDALIVPMFSKILPTAAKVKLSGMVQRPGTYNISEGETLSNLITRAGGYKYNAYPYGGVFFRKSAEEMSAKFNKRIYSDTINFLVSNLGTGGGNSSQPLTGDFLKILIEESKAQDSIGRIIAEFDLNKLKTNPALDTKLMDSDVINIPAISQQVYLFGDFNQPLILSYDPEYGPEDYISLAAGRKSSSTKHTIIIDPDGKSHYFSSSRFGMFNENIDIYPGSIIYLPRELGKVDGVQFAAAVAPILSSLTLSLASINTITDD